MYSIIIATTAICGRACFIGSPSCEAEGGVIERRVVGAVLLVGASLLVLGVSAGCVAAQGQPAGSTAGGGGWGTEGDVPSLLLRPHRQAAPYCASWWAGTAPPVQPSGRGDDSDEAACSAGARVDAWRHRLDGAAETDVATSMAEAVNLLTIGLDQPGRVGGGLVVVLGLLI